MMNKDVFLIKRVLENILKDNYSSEELSDYNKGRRDAYKFVLEHLIGEEEDES